MGKPTTILTSRDDHLADLLAAPAPMGIASVARFDHMRQRWLIWNGVRWRPDRQRIVYDLIRQRVAAWWEASDDDVSPDTLGDEKAQLCALLSDAGWFHGGRGDFRKTVLPMFDTGKKDAILKSLSAREGIAMAGDEWDTDPYLVGFNNGIIDLRRGLFYDTPDPTMLVSKSVGFDWDADATFAEDRGFDWFLGDIMDGDEELVAYIKRFIGYSLLGIQSEQKFWMWVGRGSNGKGVLARAIAHAFGDYADTPADTLYMRTRFGSAASSSARPDLLRLQALRFTYMSEPPGGQFNEEMLKAHTGEDAILARDLYGKAENFVRFSPTHKIVFLTNDPPKTDDVGVSMRRRVRVIQFERDYSVGPDVTLEEHLKTQRQAIIRLAVLEAIRWMSEGLPEPKRIGDWSDEYISENDPLSAFFTERCVIGKGINGSASSLFAAYEEWCGENKVEVKTRTGFGLAVSRRYEKKHLRDGWAYCGVRAKNAMELAQDAVDGA